MQYEKSFYQVFELQDPFDKWSYDENKVLFESDNLGEAHNYAWNERRLSSQTKSYTIIQPYYGSCRGGCGAWAEIEDNAEESPNDESHLPIAEQSLVFRLRKRAEIRRNNSDRKSVQEGKPDRISDLLEEAANEIEKLRKNNGF